MIQKRFAIICGLAALILFPFLLKANAAAPVQVTEDAGQIVLDNGLVGISVNKADGVVTSLRAWQNGQSIELGDGRRAMLYDFDNHSHQHATLGQNGTVRLALRTSDEADVSVGDKPTAICPFRTEIHWILRRGDSGFYTYAVYRHTKGMPACTWEQTRVLIRAARGTSVFTETWPELCILREADWEAAQALLKDWQASRADGGADWTWPNCGEQSEGQFSACWNCSQEKPSS